MITVVIPIYNTGHYLRFCLDSVLAQTYKNIEVICIDDGSTDDCPQICEEYASRDNRIRVVHRENGGLSIARNNGIEIANGEYITFIDSDDMIDSDMLQYLYERIISCQADISVCQSQRINENNAIIECKLRNNKRQDALIDGNESCMYNLFVNPWINITAWGKLYKTELFSDIRYPENRYHEDVFTTYKLMAKTNRMVVGDAPKYLYRIRSASITQQTFSPKHLDAIYGKLEMRNFIRDHYPVLLKYANGGVVYAANQCLYKMAQADCKNKEHIDFLQRQYRCYEFDYLLYSRSSFISKCFSLLAYMNTSLLLNLLRVLNR